MYYYKTVGLLSIHKAINRSSPYLSFSQENTTALQSSGTNHCTNEKIHHNILQNEISGTNDLKIKADMYRILVLKSITVEY